MPYIEQADRIRFITEQKIPIPANAGELNYLISRLIFKYYSANGQRYAQINDVMGAIEGAKLEFYRRVAVPYEDLKCSANGDVYK